MKIDAQGLVEVSHADMKMVFVVGEGVGEYVVSGIGASIRVAPALSEDVFADDDGLARKLHFTFNHKNPLALFVETDPVFGEIRVMPLSNQLFQRFVETVFGDPVVKEKIKEAGTKLEAIAKDLPGDGQVGRFVINLLEANYMLMLLELIPVLQKHFPDLLAKMMKTVDAQTMLAMTQQILRTSK